MYRSPPPIHWRVWDTPMNDSAGKFGIDQLEQAAGNGKKPIKRVKESKAVFRATWFLLRNPTMLLVLHVKLVMLHNLKFLSFV